jgi:S1-C subfamily serine protease
VYVLAASLAPGDSGGALVDATGHVVGVAFAIAPDRPGTAYALSDEEVKAVLAQRRRVVDTGACLAG